VNYQASDECVNSPCVGDDNMAAAIIDRLVHHGRLLQFRGESYRVNNALMK